MKYSWILAAALALSACEVDTPAPNETAPERQAGTVGIDFAAMPVGTQAHYRDGDGNRWTETYRGQEGRFHVMETRVDGNVTRTHYYNRDGTLRRRVYANGNVRTFSPRRCARVLGECRFASSDTKPQRSSQNQGHLIQDGDIFTYTYGPTDGSRRQVFVYELGPYNLISRASSGQYRERLVRVVTP